MGRRSQIKIPTCSNPWGPGVNRKALETLDPDEYMPILALVMDEIKARQSILVTESSEWNALLQHVAADPLGDNHAEWDHVFTCMPFEDTSLILQLLANISSGTEVFRNSLPSSLMEPRSFLERCSDMYARPDLLGKISEGKTRQERLHRVVQWYLSGLHLARKMNGARKPYTPATGETFRALFSSEDHSSQVVFVAEQIEHFPPRTLFSGKHIGSGTTAYGYYEPRPYLSGVNCISTQGIGHIRIHVPLHDETYHVPLWPNLNLYGLFAGKLSVEVEGQVDISLEGSCGVGATLSFSTTGWFGKGVKDFVTIVMEDGKKRYEGQWTSTIRCTNTQSVFLEATGAVRPKAFVKHTDALPSRWVWRDLTLALRHGHNEWSNEAKKRIEAKHRAGNNSPYTPLYFVENKERVWVPLEN
eukprot:PhF_6_TR27019/c0_g1_i1/m.39462